jgi:hypothetical protein
MSIVNGANNEVFDEVFVELDVALLFGPLTQAEQLDFSDYLVRAGAVLHFATLLPDQHAAVIIRHTDESQSAPPVVLAVVAFEMETDPARGASAANRPVDVYRMDATDPELPDHLYAEGLITREIYVDLLRLRRNPAATVSGLDVVQPTGEPKPGRVEMKRATVGATRCRWQE